MSHEDLKDADGPQAAADWEQAVREGDEEACALIANSHSEFRNGSILYILSIEEVRELMRLHPRSSAGPGHSFRR